MKIGWRISVLAIALIISIVSIINIESSKKFIILLLLIGALTVFKIVKSKVGRTFIISVFLLTAIFLTLNSFESGVIVKSVGQNSQIFNAGIRQGEIITGVNSKEVTNIQEYSKIIEELFNSQGEVKLEISTTKNKYVLLTNETPPITVSEIKKTNIKTGLEIGGGARALVKPEKEITDAQLDDLIAVSRNRFNIFGLSDISIRATTDLSGGKFMLVEVAGATPDDLKNLISQQGKFEAKIANKTVFTGGNEDITSVCRNDASCASITNCFQQGGQYICSFQFSITLNPAAAQKHADITRDIPLDLQVNSQYLSENLTLILDDKVVEELRISADLKGQATTQISIQGSGTGITQEQALADARSSMNNLQTILITGSLPFKLEIVKLDTISPALGAQFVYSILLAAIAAIVSVVIIVFVRYRKAAPSMAILLTSFSEIIIILGIASLIKWNLDLPSIAGILATIGTGVDQQIVILDESRSTREASLKQRMKRALFIVFSAYFASLVSLLPLYWAGAGLFRGFAFTSIIGITAGVLITRPAFAEIIKKLEEKQ